MPITRHCDANRLTVHEVWPERVPFGDYYWVSPEALESDDRPDDYWDRRR